MGVTTKLTILQSQREKKQEEEQIHSNVTEVVAFNKRQINQSKRKKSKAFASVGSICLK